MDPATAAGIGLATVSLAIQLADGARKGKDQHLRKAENC
jgi:hypothetical protein